MFSRTVRCTLSILAVVFVSLPARAELLSTDRADPAQAAQSERERVQALVARPEVAKKLEVLGVLPENAKSRIDALTDQEVQALAGRIDALPAGALSDTNWLLVILIILLILLVA